MPYNLDHVHKAFNELHRALAYAASVNNDPLLKAWADQLDEEHHEFYNDTRNDYVDIRR